MPQKEAANEIASIRVEGNAVGSALITGDGNTVTIIYATGVIPTTRPPIASNPYRGLDAFDESSSQFFFGRERVVGTILKQIERLTSPTQPDNCRLFAIVGPSGCGKTSVARAGLLPALAHAKSPWLRNPSVAIFTPGHSPIESLADALARLISGTDHSVGRQREFASLLRERSQSGLHDGISEVVRKYIGFAVPVLILVDQFEETYTLEVDAQKALPFDWRLEVDPSVEIHDIAPAITKLFAFHILLPDLVRQSANICLNWVSETVLPCASAYVGCPVGLSGGTRWTSMSRTQV
jgi:hypothetical protein